MNSEPAIARLRAANDLKLADYEPYHQALRPRMLELVGCERVWLQGVTFQNPPNWTMNPALCTDVLIDGVVVHNLPTAQNSDALDLESCRRAIIRNCNFDTGDDGICIKSGKDEVGRHVGVPTEDVLIEGCTVYHAHGGFTIGSEMSGGVRHLRVRNCTFMGTEVGLRFKSARGRGGVVEDIDIADIRMTGIVGNAIDFDLFYGGKSALDTKDGEDSAEVPPVDAGTPVFRDIHLHNIRCLGAGGAIVLQGLPEMPLQNTSLDHVYIQSRQGVAVVDARAVTFQDVTVQPTERPALRTVRVKDCQLGLSGVPGGGNQVP
jgi:polygalacturonase